MKNKILFVFIATIIIPSFVHASFDRDLSYGSTGDDVTQLQELLTVQGNYTGPITGNFYSLTRQGVINFQLANNISPPAGYFGPITRAKVNSILSEQESASNAQAVQETGSVTTPTKNDVITALQEQINALLAQLQQLNTQVQQQTTIQQQTQTTLQQTQQSVQQIQQNTTPQPTPTPTPAIPDLHVFNVQNVGNSSCSVQENGKILCNYLLELKYQTGKNSSSLTRPKGVSVTASIPSLNYNKTVITDDGNYGGDSRIFATFNIPVTKDGTYPVIFSANGAIYNYDLVIGDIERRKELMCQNYGAFCDSKDVAYLDMTPRIVKTLDSAQIEPIGFDGYSSQTIAKFRLSGVPFGGGYARWTSSVQLRINGSSDATQGSIRVNGLSQEVVIANSKRLEPGTYTLTINSIDEFYYPESGGKISFSGLPISFIFIVKDIPYPEIIPIETTHIYNLPTRGSSINPPGVIGSFKIKMNPNSGISIISCSIRFEGDYPKIIGTSGYPVDAFIGYLYKEGMQIVGTEINTDSNGISVASYVFYVGRAGTSAPEQYYNLPTGKLKFYVEDLKVKDQKTGLVRTVSSPPVFELEIVRP